MVQVTLESDVAITDKLAKMHREHDFEWFYDQSEMLIATDLDKIVSADEPPPIELIDDLPDALSIEDADLRQLLILYVILLEKEGEEPRFGIGTAASQQKGAVIRMKHYREDTVYMMSKNTKKSLEEGFKITKIGVLLAVKRPKKEDARPLMRGWILTCEAGFTWLFWSVWQAQGKALEDHYMGHACPWKKRWYKGLNTHSPLSEDVVGLELSKEEILEKVAKRKEKDRIRARAYYHSERGQIYYKAYTNSEERKAYMKAYAQLYKPRQMVSKSYKKQLAERKDGRVLVRMFEAGELNLDDVDQKALGKALKLKESKIKTRAKYKDRDAEVLSSSFAALRQVKAGELDGDDPEVQEVTKLAIRSSEKCKKYASTHRDSINATKRKRYTASVDALEKVEAGELDGEDPEVKKLCKVAISARENARKQKEKKSKKN